MKKWFNNLSSKYKLLLHIALWSLFFLFPSLIGDNANALIYFIWIACMVFEIIFIIWHIQYKIKNKNAQINTIENEINNEIKEKIAPQDKKTSDSSNNCININSESKNSPKKIETSVELEHFIQEGETELKLKYSYKEQLCFCENHDKISLLDKVSFVSEPDNEYDSETIAVYLADIKIGLMFKGDCRDIINKTLKNNKYVIEGYVCKNDKENNKISLKIGFYLPLDEQKSITASLIKTGKKDELTEEKRQEQVEFLLEDERVVLEDEYINDCILVRSEAGYELGELSQSVTEKIKDYTDDIDNIYAKVHELTYDDNGKLKVKLKIYL